MVLIGERRIVDLRHDGSRHVLQPFQAMERRIRLERDALDARVQLAQATRLAHESAARPESRDKVFDSSFRLVPYLVSCSVVMGTPVSIVGILVAVEVLSMIVGEELACFADRSI